MKLFLAPLQLLIKETLEFGWQVRAFFLILLHGCRVVEDVLIGMLDFLVLKRQDLVIRNLVLTFNKMNQKRDRVEREVGGGIGMGKYMYIQGWFMSMYDKNHYNIVK